MAEKVKNTQPKEKISEELILKKSRLKELEERLQRMENETESIDLIRKQKEQLLNELVEVFDQEFKQEFYLSALINCRSIIKIANELEKDTQAIEFQDKLRVCESEIQLQRQEEEKEFLAVKKQIEDLQDIINIDASILPEMEEIPITDLIGNLAEDLQNMENIATMALENHRVEVREFAKNRTILKYKSGKAIETRKEMDVKWEIPNLADPNSFGLPEYTVTNVIKNNNKDPIEEAFLQDIIPYNYEISEIQINGEQTKIEPHRNRQQEGLQLSWYLPNLEDKEKIELKYQLKPRVSRTVVLPLKESLKVIKTHSNLHGEIATEGIYNAILNFKNSYHERLNDILMEDVIPIFYTYEVEEKKSQDFPSIKESKESIVKWKINDMPEKESSEHDYHLVELKRIEELKFQAYQLIQQDINKVNMFRRKNLKKRQDRAKEFLKKFDLF